MGITLVYFCVLFLVHFQLCSNSLGNMLTVELPDSLEAKKAKRDRDKRDRDKN